MNNMDELHAFMRDELGWKFGPSDFVDPTDTLFYVVKELHERVKKLEGKAL